MRGQSREVMQLNQTTHQLVAVHRSVRAAAGVAGLSPESIRYHCDKGGGVVAGYFWQYADERQATQLNDTMNAQLTLEQNHECFVYLKRILARTPAIFSEKFSEELLKAMEEYADSVAFADELIKEKEMMLLKTL